LAVLGSQGAFAAEGDLVDNSYLNDWDCGPWSQWLAGVDMVALKPHFHSNTAFTMMQSDGVSFESFSDTNFNYDLGLSPRLWLEYRAASEIGIRSQFWRFAQSAGTESASPPANGFGRITHPRFGTVDISTTIPTDHFTADSGLKAYFVDAEITKVGNFACWDLIASAGLRYGSVEQRYTARLRNAAGVLAGSLDFEHRLEGIGPTFAVETRRPLGANVTLFANARGSLLFGPNSVTFAGGEDLDLLNPFQTTSTTLQDDILPIGEIQLGGEWRSTASAWGQVFAHGAFETQLWSGAGNASSLDGNLGLVGWSFGIGLVR
jgi:hypothetical protein